MTERLQTRITDQYEEGFFIDDGEWIDGYSTTNLDGEILAEWIDFSDARQDNQWLEQNEGYIRIKIGDILVLRLSGPEALRLQYDLQYLKADDLFDLPLANPYQIRGTWNTQWMLSDKTWNISISDNTKDELVDILSWLTANHNYKEKSR